MLTDLLAARAPILADGGIETRIMFETDLELDEHLQVAALLDDPPGRAKLREIYATYVDVAWAHDLPAIVGTPTFRASPRYARRAGVGDDTVRRLCADAFALLDEVRRRGEHTPVFVAGVIGPYGDAYTPADCLGTREAAAYHAVQAEVFAALGVDLLFAPTFPSVDEAAGAAEAMAAVGVPYAVSFVLDHDGRVLDGTSLHAAITQIDGEVAPAPDYYSISCVHPTIARRALATLHATSAASAARLLEVKANGSPLSPDELVALDHLETDAPEQFGEEMFALWRDFDVPIVGGCCGTSVEHLAALARRIEQAVA